MHYTYRCRKKRLVNAYIYIYIYTYRTYEYKNYPYPQHRDSFADNHPSHCLLLILFLTILTLSYNKADCTIISFSSSRHPSHHHPTIAALQDFRRFMRTSEIKHVNFILYIRLVLYIIYRYWYSCHYIGTLKITKRKIFLKICWKKKEIILKLSF